MWTCEPAKAWTRESVDALGVERMSKMCVVRSVDLWTCGLWIECL